VNFIISFHAVCKRIRAPEFGSISCDLGEDGEANPGDTCTFSCDEGFELGETSMQRCREDGDWVPFREPECVIGKFWSIYSLCISWRHTFMS